MKKALTVLVSMVTVSAFLVSIGAKVGAMEANIAANAEGMKVLRADIRADMRELRAAHTRHLESHIPGHPESEK